MIGKVVALSGGVTMKKLASWINDGWQIEKYESDRTGIIRVWIWNPHFYDTIFDG